MRTRSHPRTLAQRCPAGVRPPTGAHQQGFLPSPQPSCQRAYNGGSTLSLRVQPPWKTLHKTKSVLVPCSVINNVDEEDAARIPSQSSRCIELIFYNYIYTTHPARTPTAWHGWLYLSPGHLSLCQTRIKNAAAHSTVQLNDRDINGII